MTPIITPIYTVYLLHFDAPVGRNLHYLGICKSHRLHWRMLEHLRGTGASLTARASEAGIGWEIVRTWQTSDPGKESQLKRAGRFNQHCWKCQNLEPYTDPKLYRTHYEPIPVKIDFKPIDHITGSRFSRYRK